MSVTIKEQKIDCKCLVFKWTKTETVTVCEGKVVHCRSRERVSDDREPGTTLILQKGKSFLNVKLTKLPLNVANELLWGKNIRIEKTSPWLGMSDVELVE